MTDEDCLLLKRTVPVTTRDGQPYCVRIAVVPQPWQGDCLYAWDQEKWPGGQPYCPL